MKSARLHKFVNPERQTSVELPSIISHEIYSLHKNQRKNVQHKRKDVEHQVSYLERQARRTVKQLFNNQKTLVNCFKIKSQRLQEKQRKDEWKRLMQQNQDNMRKTNTMLRQLHLQKKTENLNDVHNRNNRSAKSIKQQHRSLERKASDQKLIEQELLKKRNQAFSNARTLGMKYSRARSFYQNKCKSSLIKNELISIEDKVKERQMDRIANLSQKQVQLMEIVEKSKKQKNQYEKVLANVKYMNFNELYNNAVQNGLKIKEDHGKAKKNRKHTKSIDSLSQRSTN